MTIQIEIPHSIKAKDAFKAPLIAALTEKLDKYDKEISRLDVHLSDENGPKKGINDKRCLLEAHISHMPHVVVTAHADQYEQAVDAAIDKLIASLQSIHGHKESRHRAAQQQEVPEPEE